jgi:ADP-heptose:LPS heptosyltransferase
LVMKMWSRLGIQTAGTPWTTQFGGPRNDAAARVRPLVMRCGAFGDMVLLSVLIQQLSCRFGCPVDVVTSGPWSLPLLQCQKDVGEVFVLGSRKTPYWISARQKLLVRWLRTRPPGPVWFADPGPAGRDLLRRAGIPDSMVVEFATLPERAGEHICERLTRLAKLTPPALQGHADPLQSELAPNARLHPDAYRVLLGPWLRRNGLGGNNYIVIQTGNKRTMRPWFYPSSAHSKYWPEDRWADVLRGLRAACPQHDIILLGVRSEFRLNARIAGRSGIARVYNVAGNVPVPILLPLLEKASGMISVDTGPAHAAAALGCPTVTLFGQADPQLYRPGGVSTPVIVLTGCVQGAADIRGITPDDVLAAWKKLENRHARLPQ